MEDRLKITDSIEKNYLKDPLSKGDTDNGYNFALHDDHTLFFSHLYEKYKRLCHKLFGNFHITPQNKTTCWCYRSNVNESYDVWHNHLASSTINGVYYYQVEEDGIAFEREGKEVHYVPQQGELLIFPNDLDHKPEKATSENLRYSINNINHITLKGFRRLLRYYIKYFKCILCTCYRFTIKLFPFNIFN